MANFNLADYETVEERIKRFYADNPDGRIITVDYTTETDRSSGVWRVQARVFLTRDDQDFEAPKATGVAFEVDGVGMANKTSALENAETSAIGRALANAGYSGNRRTSREEMEKVERGVTPGKPAQAPKDFADRVANAPDMETLNALWAEAFQGRFETQVKDLFTERKKVLA